MLRSLTPPFLAATTVLAACVPLPTAEAPRTVSFGLDPGSPTLPVLDDLDGLVSDVDLDDPDDHGDHGAPEPCVPDHAEPDDGPEAAVDGRGLHEFDRTLCSEDDTDWVRVPDVHPGELIVARAVFPGSDGDVDLELVGPSGEVVAAGRNDHGPIEWLLHVPDEPGDWFVVVSLAEDLGSDGTSYDLEVDLSVASSECVDDPLEPNGGPDAAAALGPSWYEGLLACPGEDDWYALAAEDGGELAVFLDFFASEGGLEATLWSPDGAAVAGATSAGGDDLTLAVSGTQAGSYLLHVALTEDAGMVGGNVYGLHVEGLSPACAPDVFEPNDTAEHAAAVGGGIHLDQTACPGEEDWYAVTLQAGHLVTISAGADPAEGDVDAYVYDEAMNPVAWGEGDGDEEFSAEVPASGVYLLRVVLAEDRGTQNGVFYNFDVFTTPASTCSPDVFEPNNGPAEAAFLTQGSFPMNTICAGEPDWYQIDLTGAEGCVALTLPSADAPFPDLRLRDPGGALVAAAERLGDVLHLDLTGASGTHHLEIDLGAGEADYDLELAW